MEQTRTELVEQAHVGLVGQWVTLGAGLAGRAIGTTFGVLQDVRTEIAERVGATLDWLDGSQQGTLRLVRNIHRRVDVLSKETLDAGENALSGLVSGLRTTSHEATRFASRTASVLVDAPVAN
jgi:hypothetical protein